MIIRIALSELFCLRSCFIPFSSTLRALLVSVATLQVFSILLCGVTFLFTWGLT